MALISNGDDRLETRHRRPWRHYDTVLCSFRSRRRQRVVKHWWYLSKTFGSEPFGDDVSPSASGEDDMS
jgi:hypothetical protein